MKSLLLGLSGVLILLAGALALASPEADRQKLVQLYQARYPDLKVTDYIHGALALDPDAKAQYLGIMEFPPFAGVIEQGEKLWKKPLNSGMTYADCLPNGGRMIAGNYPQFDPALGKVVTFEDAINQCRVRNGETPYRLADPATMGALTAYARGLSDGMTMNIRVDGPAALKAYEDGKKTFYARVGQLNFSCASCHVDHAGNRLRSEIMHMAVGAATH